MAAVKATLGRSEPSPPRSRRSAHRAAWSRSAPGSRAESGRTTGLESGSAAGENGVPGPSSTTTWAFVPDRPNALTPAIRRLERGSQASRAVGIRTGSRSQSMKGLGLEKFR